MHTVIICKIMELMTRLNVGKSEGHGILVSLALNLSPPGHVWRNSSSNVSGVLLLAGKGREFSCLWR